MLSFPGSGLRPTWSNSPLSGSRWCGWSGGRRGFCGHRIRLLHFFVDFDENGAVVFFALGQQWGDFAQLFGGLLQRLDLLGKLCVLGLLTQQDLVNIFHRSPCFEIYEERLPGSTLIPVFAITRVMGGR